MPPGEKLEKSEVPRRIPNIRELLVGNPYRLFNKGSLDTVPYRRGGVQFALPPIDIC